MSSLKIAPNNVKSNSTKNKVELPPHLSKDFDVQVSIDDFIGKKETEPKNLGFFDDVLTLLYKKNKTPYFIKVIDKKNIVNNSYENILKVNYDTNKIYKNHIDDYIINLETHWEDDERLYLVFEAIKRYMSLESLLKKYSNDLKEENLLTIFRHILEAVNFLHESKIYGLNLILNSFIYDRYSLTIKLTDIGFSKVFFSQKVNIFDNELKNGFSFNEYTPPEVFSKIDESYNSNELDKLQNEYYDVWQLGILFYKIATYGESPFEGNTNEDLKDSIITKNINYSKLDKYNSRIIQIIDKMLQLVPDKRYTIKQLISLIKTKENRIPVLNIHVDKNKETVLTMNIIEEQQKLLGNDVKNVIVNIDNNKEEEEQKVSDKILLNGIKIKGNYIYDKNLITNQEIYPQGSVLPSFKNKFLNKLNNVDQNLVLDLSNRLCLLDKEYKKLNENKLALYNITNYVNTYLKELNENDNSNINLLIKKFSDLLLSKKETNDLYSEMVKSKEEFSEDKYKALISNLIYEINRLEIELEHEKKKSENLRKKIKEQEKRISDLKNENQEKIEFYQKKIEVLEDVIFSSESKSMNEKEIINNNILIYNALVNSIKNFTEINKKLKESLEQNITKFKANKKNWLEDIIKAKQDFRNEVSFYLKKSTGEQKIYIFEKKEPKDDNKENKTKEEIEKLKKEISELKEGKNEQKTTIDNNTNYINELNKEIKSKREEIETLKKQLEEQKNQVNK